MNFLGHARLSLAGNDDFLFGNLIADGVRGSDLSDWSSEIEAGIRFHRRCDAVIDSHPETRWLLTQVPPASRRVAGIALDMMWDHLLAGDMRDDDIERLYRLLAREDVPSRLASLIEWVEVRDALRRYRELDFTLSTIASIGERMTARRLAAKRIMPRQSLRGTHGAGGLDAGENPLAGITPWLADNRALLQDSFARLWPDMLALRQHVVLG
ncbi:ACP phosphodiesterase [Cobetia sp. L2A1]|uniref:ACP phosphodiesterase n=1 Tax=Cobetia sp. L2A1 TaxID=2686360 RepID=UPI00131CDBEC|nr:ACP phosphodiesterase [Cobetia sp. L2A1]